MAGIDVQRAMTEVGRIRLGQLEPDPKRPGEMKAASLDTFRFTSKAEHLIREIAGLYGGEPKPWTPQGGGARQWEVVTGRNEVPVFVPRQVIESWYEVWGRGVCSRRCDGATEQLRGVPCLCIEEGAPADPLEASAKRQCKMVTRMSLMLADVPGLGRWRLESHGWYASTELGSVGDVLQGIPNDVFLPARLLLDRRERKQVVRGSDNQEKVITKRWPVPVILFDVVTSRQLQGGADALRAALGAAPAGDQAAISSTAATSKDTLAMQLHVRVAEAQTRDGLLACWEEARVNGLQDDQLKAAMTRRAQELQRLNPTPEAEQPDQEPDRSAELGLRERSFIKRIGEARTIPVLNGISIEARNAGVTDQRVIDAWQARYKQLQEVSLATDTDTPPPREVVSEPDGLYDGPIDEAEEEPEVEDEYTLLMAEAGKHGMNTDQVNRGLCEFAHVATPNQANGWQVQAYRKQLRGQR